MEGCLAQKEIKEAKARCQRPSHIFPVLEDEDVRFLVNNTSFTESDIREWWREFIMDCPQGILTKDKVDAECHDAHPQVLDMLLFILPKENGHIVADLIFTAFDRLVAPQFHKSQSQFHGVKPLQGPEWPD